MRRLLAIFVLCIVIVHGFLQADDGQRQGIITEGGIGFGLVQFNRMTSNIYYPPAKDYTQVAIASNFQVGYFLLDYLQISIFSSNYIYNYENYWGWNHGLFNGLFGISATVYLQKESPSLYFSGGYGQGYWDVIFNDGLDGWVDSGYRFELGYELSPQYRISLNLLYFNDAVPDDKLWLEANSKNISFIISRTNY